MISRRQEPSELLRRERAGGTPDESGRLRQAADGAKPRNVSSREAGRRRGRLKLDQPNRKRVGLGESLELGEPQLHAVPGGGRREVKVPSLAQKQAARRKGG